MSEKFFPFADTVKPNNAKELAAVINKAKENKTPIIVMSSSGHHRRELSKALVPGAILVDMSSMKKIISINRTFLMVVAEAGVTYEELTEELAKNNMMMATPLAPRKDKSVVADILEPQPRMNPMYQWNHMDPLRCTEVVWGDGNIMCTGEAGGGSPDLAKQQAQGKWQVNGNGPMMLDFYRILTGSVGTMGIVTWAAIKCEPLSPIMEMHAAADDNPDKLVDMAYRLCHKRLGTQLAILNKACFASVMGVKPEEVSGPEFILLSGMESGELLPELRINQQRTDIAAEAKDAGLILTESFSGFSGEEMLKACITPRDYDWHTITTGQSEDVYFVTTLERSSDFIKAINRLADKTEFKGKLQFYIQPLHQGSSCQFEVLIPYAKEQKEAAEALRAAIVDKTSEMDGYFARPYKRQETEIELGKNGEGAKLLKEVKDIFDPLHILNPGRLSTFDEIRKGE